MNYALARGHKVTLFNRGKRPSPEWPGEVEQLHGDRNTGDLKALEGRKWDVCIDNPTSLPFWVRDAGKVLKGNVGHYLFISTISVYADGSKPGITEDDALAAYKGKDAMAETQETLRADIENLYGPLKALSEAEARKQFGERVTIVRPGYIVGPARRDRPLHLLAAPHRPGRRNAGARRRRRSGADHRRPRPGRMDDPPGGGGHDRRRSTPSARRSH